MTTYVAVGSLRPPKLNAVRAALQVCSSPLGLSSIETLGFEVPSGVRSTPLSRIETMQGAKYRAECLQKIASDRQEPWQFFVGLEGGLDVVTLDSERRVFLEGWVYISDRNGHGHYGQSGAIALPPELARPVVDKGADLSDAIDAYAGAQGIRNGLGAWGVLTRGLITREDAFRIATINAFAPFFKTKHIASA
jgi:non-canonical (house-cleaning) NTP pyrophosphatase